MSGVDPCLDFSNLEAIQAVYEKCTRMTVPVRQPYSGELVFTAFSGSHQDAINKGMNAQGTAYSDLWEVPYLPIDPQDIGRSYEAIIRINSQSGKGGVAYIMESDFGFSLPKAMHIEFGRVIKTLADSTGTELSSIQLYEAFKHEYLNRTTPFALDTLRTETSVSHDGVTTVECVTQVTDRGKLHELHASGNGPIDAFVLALRQGGLADFNVLSYSEHALGEGANAQAVAYIQIQTEEDTTFFGAAIDTNITLASVKAVLSALNRSLQGR